MLRPISLYIGGDPEAFFTNGEHIIGAERVIPKEGLFTKGLGGSVVLDGVQFELHPSPANTVRGLGDNLGFTFGRLKGHLNNVPSAKLCWDGVVTMKREELDALSPGSRILGCSPSQNIYGERPMTIDPATYLKRSAGGHLHLALGQTQIFYGQSDRRPRLIPLLDIFVGNTCVMLDRDPNAAERRENYGRAGEYRLPIHGVEYRTLSNFWLRNYSLMSLAFGMANMACAVLNQTLLGVDLEDELVKIVNIDNIIEAIDTNNFGLAKVNFQRLRPFFAKYVPDDLFPIGLWNFGMFSSFADGVKEKGLEHYFPDDPMTHWTSGKFEEFNAFLRRVIR